MRDLDKLAEMQKAIVHDMMRYDINRRCRLLGNRIFHMITVGRCCLSDQDDFASRKPDCLIDRSAVADHVTGLHQNFVLFRRDIRQSFNR